METSELNAQFEKLKEDMAEHGLYPHEIIADGQIHRFHLDGGKSSNKDGYYSFQKNHQHLFGMFGHWRGGSKPVKWSSISESEMTKKDLAAFRKISKGLTKKTPETTIARNNAQKKWDTAKPITNGHPYLKLKGINGYGIRSNKSGLLVPYYDSSGKLCTIQTIRGNGWKGYEKDCPKDVSYFEIPGNGETIFLVEGYATGASIHEAMGNTVIVCGSTNGIKKCAPIIRKKYPLRSIAICSDNDQWAEGNPGITAGREAAKNIGASFTYPQFEDTSAEPTDFNDLHQLEGLEAVKKQILRVNESFEDECYLELLSETDDDSSDVYEWYLDKLVPKGEPMIIAGKAGTGKSTLALEFSCRQLERDNTAHVVYICAEGAYKNTKIKARQMGLHKHGRFHFLKRRGGGTSFKLSKEKDLELVSNALEKYRQNGINIKFVVIDSVRGMYRGNMNEDLVGQVMQDINIEICQKLEATVIYIHHSVKHTKDLEDLMDALLGSGTIVAAVRHALFISKAGTKTRMIEVCKSNIGYENYQFKASLNEIDRVEIEELGYPDEADTHDASKVDSCIDFLMEQLKDYEPRLSREIYDLAETLGFTSSNIKTAKRKINGAGFYVISSSKSEGGSGAWHTKLTKR